MKIKPKDANNLLLSKGFTVYDNNSDYSGIYYSFGDVGFCLFLLNNIENDEVEQFTYYEMKPVSDSNEIRFRRTKRIDEFNPTKKSIIRGLKDIIPMLHEASRLGKELRIKIKIDEINKDFK